MSRLPTTRQVLQEHLFAKIKFLFPLLAGKIVKIICEGKTNDSIIEILMSESSFERAFDDGILNLDDKDKELYRELLFQAVAAIDQDLPAQITGMLLELPPSAVVKFLNDDEELKVAVAKARKEYLHYLKTGEESKPHRNLHPRSTPALKQHVNSEQIGELIFEKLVPLYPSKAAKLTGMLLEMDSNLLTEILKNEALFDQKVKLALSALNSL